MHIFEKLPQILGLCPIVKIRSTLEKSDPPNILWTPLNRKILLKLLITQSYNKNEDKLVTLTKSIENLARPQTLRSQSWAKYATIDLELAPQLRPPTKCLAKIDLTAKPGKIEIIYIFGFTLFRNSLQLANLQKEMHKCTYAKNENSLKFPSILL